jgi:pyruvate formate lyase activating enzyme
VDLFLYDIKMIDRERHLKYTGRDNRLILENLKKLSDAGANIHIRIPVIEGVNADEADMDEIIEFLTDGVSVDRINLLPYHTMGRDKYKRVGIPENVSFTAPSDRKIDELARRFRESGFSDVRIGG